MQPTEHKNHERFSIFDVLEVSLIPEDMEILLLQVVVVVVVVVVVEVVAASQGILTFLLSCPAWVRVHELTCRG